MPWSEMAAAVLAGAFAVNGCSSKVDSTRLDSSREDRRAHRRVGGRRRREGRGADGRVRARRGGFPAVRGATRLRTLRGRGGNGDLDVVPVNVVADGSPVDCSIYMPDQKTGLYLRCSPEIPAVSKVTVTISEGIVAEAGTAALHDAEGATSMTVELPPEQDYQSCRIWTETRPTDL